MAKSIHTRITETKSQIAELTRNITLMEKEIENSIEQVKIEKKFLEDLEKINKKG